ncbi:FAD binding domain in molybdopterin dehydrogenase [Pantoea agglomerans]|uniref:FAD binding domain in molybdopterin dehydrogenase n=1 Tax=Enterobacter agglomerans TaxID=549 RepID=A0A379LUN6_ENTAG|nr:FAD binding domain in molybdopterin dehydrogenase [Pantoea agglomerans]
MNSAGKSAQSPEEAAALKQQSGSQFLAGGTTQLDLMKCGVFTPPQLIGHHWIDRA